MPKGREKNLLMKPILLSGFREIRGCKHESSIASPKKGIFGDQKPSLGY